MIQADSTVLFLTALMLLILPLDWVLAAVVAGCFHELCHILMVHAAGGKITGISVRSGGCVIDTDPLGEGKQFLSILAGPLGSLSLLLLCRYFPKISICGLIHGLYNLIPVLPLDGGRLLQLVLNKVCRDDTKTILNTVSVISCCLMNLLAIWLVIVTDVGIWPVIFTLVWNLKHLPRKIPCKQTETGVQ